MLRQMIFERRGFVRAALYDDPDYAALHDNPEFLEPVGRPDATGWSREKGWAYEVKSQGRVVNKSIYLAFGVTLNGFKDVLDRECIERFGFH